MKALPHPGQSFFFKIIHTSVGMKGETVMKTAIEARNIRKERQGTAGLRRCSFSVREGEIYGLVGVNGWKNHTNEDYSRMDEAGGGRDCGLRWHGQQTARTEIQRHIGSLIEMPLFYEHLSAAENLEIHLAYMGAAVRYRRP